MVSWALLIQGS